MRYYYFFILMLTFLLSFSFVQAAEIDDSGVEKRQVYHVYQDIDLIPATKTNYGNHHITVKSTYPKLTSETLNESVETFNQLVDDILKDEFTAFKKQVISLSSAQQNLPASLKIKNDLIIDFSSSIINTADKPIISIRFNMQGYIAGMAHPFHRHRVLNFDLDSAQKLELADLFKPESDYLKMLSTYSRKVLQKKLTDTSLLIEGTEPTPENYKNWNIKPNGLLITFDEYQVAPYVFGTQSVLVPYSQLKNIISPKSPIAICLKHKNKCLRSNLLTGGFMDEA